MSPQPEDPSKQMSRKNVLDYVGRLHTVSDWVIAFLGIVGVPVAGLTLPTLVLKLLSWLFGTAIAAGMSFLDLMWLTAPLTVAIALTLAAGRARVYEGFFGCLVVAGITLVSAAFLSEALGIGKTINWQVTVWQLWKEHPFNIQLLFIVPLALLGDYFKFYQPGPFIASLAVGLLVGCIYPKKR